MRERKNWFLKTLLLYILIVSLMPILTTKAPPFTEVYIDPPSVTEVEGATFTVDIKIFNVTDLYAWEARLSWDPALLDVTTAVKGPFLTGPDGTIFISKKNQTAGYVDMVESILGFNPGVDGSGTLASVTFFVELGGTTPLNLSKTQLLDSSYPTPKPIEHNATSGNFIGLFRPRASFTFSPPTPLSGDNVTFDATSSYDLDGSVVSYDWDFGDGTFGAGNITDHTYTMGGEFSVTLTVTDNEGFTGSTTQLVRVLSRLGVKPTSGPVGTRVTVEGAGFQPFASGELYYDDQFLTWMIQTDENGTFTATFNIPPSEPGPHDVKVLLYYIGEFNVTTFTVTDTTPLEVNVEVGEIHFRGEIAEFFIQTVFKGALTDATSIQATLYKPIGTEVLSVQQVATGLYKAPFTVPTTAPTGTYLLVVEATYQSDTEYVDSKGAAFNNFLLSPTLTNWNAWLTEIKGNVAIIKTDTGTIKTDLTNINAKIVNIEGDIATIQSDIGLIKTDVSNIDAKIVSIQEDIVSINVTLRGIEGNVTTIKTSLGDIGAKVTSINGTVVTIKTTVGALQGTLTSIEGKTATIQTDVGTIKTTLQGWAGATTSMITPQGTFNILSLTTSTLEGSPALSDNVLTITVSGPIGTQGITNVVLPKQLLSATGTTIDKISITIDDKIIPFTYNELQETYVLRIAYTHSTHTIRVYLTGAPPTPFPLNLLVAIILLLVVVAGAAIYAFRIRNSRITSKPEGITDPSGNAKT